MLALGLTVQPAAAGILQISCLHGGQGGFSTVQPGGFVLGGQPNLVSAGQSSAGFLVPVGQSTAGFILPSTFSTGSFYSNAWPSTGGFVAPGAFSLPVSSFSSPATFSSPASFSSGIAGFTTDEAAAYSSSPNLATYLGGQFPAFHKALVTHAQTRSRQGSSGQSLIQELKNFATTLLPKIVPILGTILGDATSSNPLINEIMGIVQGIAGSAGGTGGPAGTTDGSGPIIINVTCDGKTTTTTIPRGGKGSATGNGTTPVPVVPPHPLTPPPPPAAFDPTDMNERLDKIAKSLDALVEASKKGAQPAK
jgi:hypothetical protein